MTRPWWSVGPACRAVFNADAVISFERLVFEEIRDRDVHVAANFEVAWHRDAFLPFRKVDGMIRRVWIQFAR